MLKEILKEVKYKYYLSRSGRIPAADYCEHCKELPPL